MINLIAVRQHLVYFVVYHHHSFRLLFSFLFMAPEEDLMHAPCDKGLEREDETENEIPRLCVTSSLLSANTK